MQSGSGLAGPEALRRAFVWAGLVFGSALFLRGIVEPQVSFLLGMLILVAWVVDRFTMMRVGPNPPVWVGPVSLVVIVAVGALLRTFL